MTTIIVGSYEYGPEEILDELNCAGEYALCDWAEPRLADPDFLDRLAAEAASEFAVNGDLDAGYNEMSAIISTIRELHHQETRPTETPAVSVPEPGPRSRLSELAERLTQAKPSMQDSKG